MEVGEIGKASGTLSMFRLLGTAFGWQSRLRCLPGLVTLAQPRLSATGLFR